MFRGLPPGEYALTALHDEDGNGSMTTSTLGLPEEGYAASRGATREGIGKPDWGDAKFRYRGGSTHLKARMLYR